MQTLAFLKSQDYCFQHNINNDYNYYKDLVKSTYTGCNCQTPIPVQTWELTLLSPGNNNKNKNLTQILAEGAKL